MRLDPFFHVMISPLSVFLYFIIFVFVYFCILVAPDHLNTHTLFPHLMTSSLSGSKEMTSTKNYCKKESHSKTNIDKVESTDRKTPKWVPEESRHYIKNQRSLVEPLVTTCISQMHLRSREESGCVVVPWLHCPKPVFF